MKRRRNALRHDVRRAACRRIAQAGKDDEMDHDIIVLNIVAGAYACNEPARIDRDAFARALNHARALA